MPLAVLPLELANLESLLAFGDAATIKTAMPVTLESVQQRCVLLILEGDGFRETEIGGSLPRVFAKYGRTKKGIKFAGFVEVDG